MVHATVPMSSSNFCNIIASRTKQAAQTIQDLMVFVERMVGAANELIDKAGSEGKPWISGLFDYRVTPRQAALHHLCN